MSSEGEMGFRPRPDTPSLLERLEQQKNTFSKNSRRRQSILALSVFDPGSNESIPETPLSTFTQRFKVKKTERKSTGGMMMGVRETEECIDRLKKENFDMKLELFHRREKWIEMNEKCQLVDELQDKNEALLDRVEQLQDELNSRDQALYEATLMIDQYQSHVEEIERANEKLRTFLTDGKPQMGLPKLTRSSQALSVAATPIKEKALQHIRSTGARRIVRTPARPVIEEHDSYVTEYGPVSQPPTRPSSVILDSPALSTLSESSFASVYGLKAQSVSDFGEDGEGLGFQTPSRQLESSPAVEITLADLEDSMKRMSPRARMLEYRRSLEREAPKSTISLSPTPSPLPENSKSLRRCVSFMGPELAGLSDNECAGGTSPNLLSLPTPNSSFGETPTNIKQTHALKHGLISPLTTPSPTSQADTSFGSTKTVRRPLFHKPETSNTCKTTPQSNDNGGLQRSKSVQSKKNSSPQIGFGSISKKNRASIDISSTGAAITVTRTTGGKPKPPPIPKKPALPTRPKSEATTRKKETPPVRPASKATLLKISAETRRTKEVVEVKKVKEVAEAKRRPWNSGPASKIPAKAPTKP